MKRSYESNTSRMNDAEKQNLIELVKQRSCLWNEEDVQYKNFAARAKAWREVAKEMEITFERTFDADVLQRTFKNLRDVYVRKRRAYQDAVRRNSGLQAGALERIRAWPFYNSFVFLDPVNDQGERYCNVETNYNDPLVDVEEISDITAAEAFDMQSENGSMQTQSQTLETGSMQSQVPSVRAAPPPPKTKKSSKRQQKISAIEQFASVFKENFENPDTFESMGHLLSSNMRDLNARNPDLAEEFAIKFNEFLVELSRAKFESKKSPT